MLEALPLPGSRRLAVPIWLLGLVGLVVVVGIAVAVWRPWTPAAETHRVLADNGEFTARIVPAAGAAIAQEEAVRRAGQIMARAEEARGVRARRALVSLTNDAGEMTMTPRQVWLVTYDGVAYAASPTCSCHLVSTPHTTVLVDAQSGQVLMAFGSAL